ncbi:selenoneine biosynthesis selenosugar synthase SenB [Marinobacter confluentis]|uniref:TIGR04348 family glycosyltransferase n=1 Tax=Marinobacter confluentis TaxID=1697557 RepID=A0A4Z1BG02_9GAMM|nr:selenoneine biosynthesis selenosugar synthase SenB [Marinobacter confluentis]TGN41674.1 TIGR04348 family glycosyltransferase [Marinobacter confluentis]
MMIVIITPAPTGSKAGNRATAERWAGLLEHEGHQVSVQTDYIDTPCDLLIALHAWRSHSAVARFRKVQPRAPLIVVLTGTDIYHHQHKFPEDTLRTMEQADCLVGLHRRVALDIPERFAPRLMTVLQSAEQLGASTGDTDNFQLCVIGHLRDEKDALRAALAARLLPDDSAIKVINAGKPHTPEWEAQARQEQETNPRFEWIGEIDKPAIQALMRQSKLMVISSVMEGGANVVSEACRAGLPILASDISGNIGLLGDEYPGYFRTGDHQDLAQLLTRAENSPSFLAELKNRVSRRAADFTPEAEQASLAAAIDRAVAQRAALNRANPSG